MSCPVCGFGAVHCGASQDVREVIQCVTSPMFSSLQNIGRSIPLHTNHLYDLYDYGNSRPVKY